jgi:hypothetical protein
MRTSNPSGPRTPLRGRTRHVALLALVTALTLAGCGRGGDDAPAAPSPEPGQAILVAGRAGLVFHDLSTSGTLVFPTGSDGDLRVVTDEAVLQAAAAEIRTWLDQVLSERNRGLTTTAAAGGIDAAAFATALGVDGPSTDGLLDTQVANATYLIEIAHLGEPGWALARVESLLVSSTDPATEIGRRLDTFVFTIDASGAIEFLALEVAP